MRVTPTLWGAETGSWPLSRELADGQARYWLPSSGSEGFGGSTARTSVTQRDSGLRGRSVAGEPVMESRQQEQTVELDVEQG